MICQGCGGVLGRDCFNQYDCMQITNSMNEQQIVEPYIEAMKEAIETINWLWEKCSVDDPSLQSDYFNIPANTLDMLSRFVPSPPKTPEQIKQDLDDLPF